MAIDAMYMLSTSLKTFYSLLGVSSTSRLFVDLADRIRAFLLPFGSFIETFLSPINVSFTVFAFLLPFGSFFA